MSKYKELNEENDGSGMQPMEISGKKQVRLLDGDEISIEKALKHQKEYQVLTQDKEQLSVFCSLNELFHTGPSLPLYLDYLMNATFLIGVQLLISGGFRFYSYQSGFFCTSSFESDCTENRAAKYSLMNIIDDPIEHGKGTQDILVIIAILILMIITQILVFKHERLEFQIDLSRDTPSDYTVRVQNIPTDIEKSVVEERLKSLFGKYGFDVVNILVAYNVNDHIRLVREWKDAKDAYENKDKGIFTSEEDLKVEFHRLNAELNDRISKKRFRQNNAGNAFLTFKTQDQVETLNRHCSRNFLQRTFTKDIKVKPNGPALPNKFFFGDSTLAIERAPEPTDIFWENLSLGFIKRLPHKLSMVIVSVILLSASVTLLSYLESLRVEALENEDQEEGKAFIEKIFTFEALVLPLCIVSVNLIARLVLKFLIKYSKPETYTEFILDSTYWQILVKYVNSTLVIVIMVANSDFKQPPDQIVSLVENIMLANSFLPALVNFFVDPDYLIYLLKYFYAKFKKARGAINQDDFNRAHEYPELDMIDRYSSAYLILLLGFTFSPMLPHTSLIGVIGLLLMYLCDKYVITRRTSVFADLSGELSFKMICHFDYLIVIYCLSDYLWDKFYVEGINTYEKNSALTIAIPILVILYKVIPFPTFIQDYYSFKKIKNSSTEYENMQAKFGENKNYQKDNPTSYLHKLEEATSEQEKQEILDRLVKFSVSQSLQEVLKESGASLRRKFSKKKSKSNLPLDEEEAQGDDKKSNKAINLME